MEPFVAMNKFTVVPLRKHEAWRFNDYMKLGRTNSCDVHPESFILHQWQWPFLPYLFFAVWPKGQQFFIYATQNKSRVSVRDIRNLTNTTYASKKTNQKNQCSP
jgi:hypothetical protein